MKKVWIFSMIGGILLLIGGVWLLFFKKSNGEKKSFPISAGVVARGAISSAAHMPRSSLPAAD